MAVLSNPKHERAGKFYVYALVDPRDQSIFYVGKGTGKRDGAHYREWRSGRVVNAEKFQRIGDIVAAGKKPESVIVLDGLTEGDAYAEERRIIAEIGIENLTNVTPGQVTGTQKLIAWAKDGLTLLKPFDQWVSERTRSKFEISLFHRFVAEIRRLAALNGDAASA